MDGQLAETGPASDETEPAPDHDDRQVTPPRRSPQEVLAGLPPHLLYAWPDGDRSDLDEAALLAEAESILATRAGRLLFDDEAAVVLAAARVAARAGNFQRAGDCYARLHDSRLASESIPEEVVLHLRRGLPIRAATLARTAPPEARSPELQLAHAYVAFVDSPARAYRLLRSLPPDADCHLQAQILRARCLLAMEDSDREHAKLLLRNAARHQGRLGAHAQELLDLISGS